MKKVTLLIIYIVLCSCSPKITTSISKAYPLLDENEKVIVFNSESELPKDSKKIGTTKIGDSGFTTNCSFEVMVEKAKNEAKKSGANAILITEHIYPNPFGSSCHRIKADLFKLDSYKDYVGDKIKSDSILDLKNSKINQEILKNNDSNNSQEVSRNNSLNKNKFTKKLNFLLLANVAQSYRVAGTQSGLNSEQKKYIKQLKSGLSYDISAYYLKDSEGGIGLKYNVYLSDGVIKNQPLTLQDGTIIRGDFTDNIKITFIGPSFILSQNENAKVGEANLEIALGYMSYVNNSTVIGAPIKISGGNLGMIGGMGYHFRLTPNVLLGPQVNFVGGVLRKLKYKYPDGRVETVKLDEDSFENLWRIDLALSAKFRF